MKKHMAMPKGHAKVEKVMHEYKEGTLRSPSGTRPSRKQAIAIALSEQRRVEGRKATKAKHK
jgi:hypothetical protein